MEPSLITKARRAVVAHAEYYNIAKDLSDGKIETIARNASSFIVKQLAEAKQSLVGSSHPPYTIEKWSDISVKRRSLFGESAEGRKGYVTAMTCVSLPINKKSTFAREFAPEDLPQVAGAPQHHAYLFITHDIWKITDNTKDLHHTKIRKLENRLKTALDTKKIQELIDAGRAYVYQTDVAALRLHNLRKSKKDQRRAKIYHGPGVETGLTWSMRDKKIKQAIPMMEMSQIISLFGEGALKIYILPTKKMWIFQNRFITYLVEF